MREEMTIKMRLIALERITTTTNTPPSWVKNAIKSHINVHQRQPLFLSISFFTQSNNPYSKGSKNSENTCNWNCYCCWVNKERLIVLLIRYTAGQT